MNHEASNVILLWKDDPESHEISTYVDDANLVIQYSGSDPNSLAGKSNNVEPGLLFDALNAGEVVTFPAQDVYALLGWNLDAPVH